MCYELNLYRRKKSRDIKSNGTGLHQVIVVSHSQNSPKAGGSEDTIPAPGRWDCAGSQWQLVLSELRPQEPGMKVRHSSWVSQRAAAPCLSYKCWMMSGNVIPKGVQVLVQWCITYITIFLLLLILLKATQNGFNLLKAITEWFGMEGNFRGFLGGTSQQWASSTWSGCNKNMPSPTLNFFSNTHH